MKRRSFVHLLAMFGMVIPSRISDAFADAVSEEIVIVDGWVLKASDVAAVRRDR